MSEVEVTTDPPVIVELTLASPLTIEIKAPTPNVIEIQSPGVQGPAGPTTYIGTVGGQAPDFIFSPESYTVGGKTP